jgi:hypothetical protein
VLWPAVQYYTGQSFDLAAIAAAAHAAGALCGVDAAHGIGNVALDLHAAGVDFAVWCSYKYVNAGPGGIGGLFVHERWAELLGGAQRPHMAGWWGSRRDGRFAMGDAWQPAAAPAARLQLSNPAALLVATLRASLETFGEAGGAASSPGYHRYSATFSVANPNNTIVAGTWACDDTCSIYINGALARVPSANYKTMSVFSISRGFVAGTNTIQVVVWNGWGVGSTVSFKLPMLAAGDQIWFTANYMSGMLGAIASTGGLSVVNSSASWVML